MSAGLGSLMTFMMAKMQKVNVQEFKQEKGDKRLQLNILGQNQERHNHLMLKDFTKRNTTGP